MPLASFPELPFVSSDFLEQNSAKDCENAYVHKSACRVKGNWSALPPPMPDITRQTAVIFHVKQLFQEADLSTLVFKVKWLI